MDTKEISGFNADINRATAVRGKKIADFLIQTKKEPEIFETPYTGMQGANDGVVGMVEVAQSKFKRPETMTEVDISMSKYVNLLSATSCSSCPSICSTCCQSGFNMPGRFRSVLKLDSICPGVP